MDDPKPAQVQEYRIPQPPRQAPVAPPAPELFNKVFKKEVSFQDRSKWPRNFETGTPEFEVTYSIIWGDNS